jgi:hypothetical protein
VANRAAGGHRAANGWVVLDTKLAEAGERTAFLADLSPFRAADASRQFRLFRPDAKSVYEDLRNESSGGRVSRQD